MVDNGLLRLRNPYQRGDRVAYVQELLNDRGYRINVDGIYGPNTQKAVI